MMSSIFMFIIATIIVGFTSARIANRFFLPFLTIAVKIVVISLIHTLIHTNDETNRFSTQ